MNTIQRKDCEVIRNRINEALENLGEELGLVICAGNASYSDTSVTFKVECIVEGVDKAKENFERDCHQFQIPASAYKQGFIWRGRSWILEGLKVRSPKYPIIASKAGEKGQYKLPEDAIADLFVA